jgi:2-polyprenyl-3-methyl-5-hydroxy-6-metoxy-1,4-benzoquinol methylase
MAKQDIERLSKIYNHDYYENGIAIKKSNYVNYSWERLGKYFQKTAKHIKDIFSPTYVLDVGCAKGYLVKALTELNIDAKGIDPSKYALSEADESIKNLLKNDIVQAIKYEDNSFDLVTCFDVMEHIPEKDVDKAIAKC